MPRKPKTTHHKSIPTIVVAGDVCIDWLSVPVDSLKPEDSPPPRNWQLRGGRHMFARRGGGWLTADFLEAAVGNSAMVRKPGKEKVPLENVPPDKIIHSMLMLGSSDRLRDKEKVPYWVVKNFEGYAGPLDSKQSKVKSVENDAADAQLVLLDDSGNGFRDYRVAWPRALNKNCNPVVLYKVRSPLATGPLWKHLEESHLERTIALVTADDLRNEGGSISRGLSWERTMTDLTFSLTRESRFADLRKCAFLITMLGIEAVGLTQCVKGKVSGSHLWYLPNLTEGALLRRERGDMGGFGSSFAAVIAAALVRDGAQTGNRAQIERALRNGIPRGLVVMDRLLEHAFGPCKIERPKRKSGVVTSRPPQFQLEQIFKTSSVTKSSVCDVKLPDLPVEFSSKDLSRYRSWRILDSKFDGLFSDKAAEVVRKGVDKVFPSVPLGKFGRLSTLDRSEIESYRSVSNLIKEFLNNPHPKRPLCLAVFGPPGGGKSFGVTEVAQSLDKSIEKMDFNVSQWNDQGYLVSALHRVRDFAIRGKVPLVFFDEFDSQAHSQKLGWLKYFLAPMQDGDFADGLFTHQIGKAIFVFAGGTSTTYAEFRDAIKSVENEAESNQATNGSQDIATVNNLMVHLLRDGGSTAKEDLKSAKLPDFDSRLRGHVDVFGLEPPTDTNLLRRALVLRSNIEKSYQTLIDGSGAMRIDNGVLRAFLQVPGYYHGARSLEAILEMSHLAGRSYFDPSLLPPQPQLNLHVDSAAFMVLVQNQPPLAPVIQQIAEQIHERYVASELIKKDANGKRLHKIGDWPSLNHWQKLPGIYKRSNCEQAAYYPTLLAAARCSFEYGAPSPSFSFSRNEIEKLARMEHDRWVEERRLKQPEHVDLVPWEKLHPDEKEKDIRTIEVIPEILKLVGLRIVRLS